MIRNISVKKLFPNPVSVLVTAVRITLTSLTTRDNNAPLGLSWKNAISICINLANKDACISATIVWPILFIKMV